MAFFLCVGVKLSPLGAPTVLAPDDDNARWAQNSWWNEN
jgi:hypothetical protein